VRAVENIGHSALGRAYLNRRVLSGVVAITKRLPALLMGASIYSVVNSRHLNGIKGFRFYGTFFFCRFNMRFALFNAKS